MGKGFKALYDVVIRPGVNQIVKMGTNRQDSFSYDKWMRHLLRM